jgi:hypothetical protein
MDLSETGRDDMDCIHLAQGGDLRYGNERSGTCNKLGISKLVERLLASRSTLSSVERVSLFYLEYNYSSGKPLEV